MHVNYSLFELSIAAVTSLSELGKGIAIVLTDSRLTKFPGHHNNPNTLQLLHLFTIRTNIHKKMLSHWQQ